MTMTHSSRWLLLCLVPLAACGGVVENGVSPENAVVTGPVLGPVCSTANENGSLDLACPDGQTIASIAFASYGTPSGSCGSFAQGVCDASQTIAIIQNECVGKPSCSV